MSEHVERRYPKSFWVTPETYERAFRLCPKSMDMGEFIGKVLTFYEDDRKQVQKEVYRES